MTQIDHSTLGQVYAVSIVCSVVASCLHVLSLRISIVLPSKAVSELGLTAQRAPSFPSPLASQWSWVPDLPFAVGSSASCHFSFLTLC